MNPNTGSGNHANSVNPLDPRYQQQPNHTVVQIPQQPASQEVTKQPNQPSLVLLQGSRVNYVKVGVPLYEAAMKGDWKTAKPILEKQPDLVRCAITENEETLLHIAASAESTKYVEEFVKNLVNMMEKKDLELQNKSHDTALSSAAAAGNLETAKAMVKKNKGLVEIPNRSRTMPLYMAALFAKPDMVRYLYEISNKMSGDFWDDENRGWVLQKCVEAEIFDVALKIVKDCPNLTVKKVEDCPNLTVNKRLVSDVLIALAQKPHVFKEKKPIIIFRIINSIFDVTDKKESEALQLLRIIWKNVATVPKTDIDDIIRGPLGTIILKDKRKMPGFPFRVLFLATKAGNVRFIVELIRLYPDIIWKKDEKGKTIFHLAVKRRQIEIYNLLYELGAMKDLITPIKDIEDNNMLHMVAKSGKPKRLQNVSGVAFQMQHELLWFKEVEKIIPPNYRQRKNKANVIADDLFTEKHVKLVEKGEEWMKDTASQCMVAATLIATIVFAAAFTLPGGYNQNTGIPFFRKEPSLIIFVIADAISLISSSTSVLIFLSILTSRYAERDFLKSLPRKLVNGLATLFLSIVTMMVAFGASFFVLYDKKLEWVPITVTSLAGIPVILYALLQYRLFRDVFKSAYRSSYLFKRSKRILYP